LHPLARRGVKLVQMVWVNRKPHGVFAGIYLVYAGQTEGTRRIAISKLATQHGIMIRAL
tara:strand:+ start:1655 stop:1831 length:177 start_codon:yes stop_codon:yes gene_type:complete